MATKILATFVLASTAFVSVPALAQSSASTTGSATIVRPVAITKNSDLAFGTIIRPGTGSGTITLPNSADSVGASGGAVALGGTVSRAKYSIAGEGGQTVSITVPANFTMTRSGGTETLTVTLSSDLGASTALDSASLGDEGTKELNVGGSFPLANSTATGAYSGNFTVSVAYP